MKDACNAHYSRRKKQRRGEGTDDDMTIDKGCTDEADAHNSNDDIGANNEDSHEDSDDGTSTDYNGDTDGASVDDEEVEMDEDDDDNEKDEEEVEMDEYDSDEPDEEDEEEVEMDEDDSDEPDEIDLTEECEGLGTTLEPDETLLLFQKELDLQLANKTGRVRRYTVQEEVLVDLLQVLKKMKAPLKAYTEILKWTKRSFKKKFEFSKSHPSRRKMISLLYMKHHMESLAPREVLFKLPQRKQTVNIVIFDARAAFSNLLSSPIANKDENFNFHRDNPFEPPPNYSPVIGDLNTGLSYLESYKALVKNVGDVLLPIPLLSDKTTVNKSYNRLSMEPINFSLGIFKHSVRSLPAAMRVLGYINLQATPDNEEDTDDDGVPTPDHKVTFRSKTKANKAARDLNDYHAQIEFILQESGFIELQEAGFKWILNYRNRKIPVTFRIYVPFIVGDTEGHDRYCGHYTARFARICQLCRICECPTKRCGYSKAKYRYRRPSKVDRLVALNETKELQAMSQQKLINGFRKVRFGSHNKRHIFGACPGEMLHLVTLGWFKYCMASFSSQAGSTSVPLGQHGVLCAEIGKSLSRQSDRELPRTNFPDGFSSGANLRAHEVPGCLLVMLFSMHTPKYHTIFGAPRFRKDKCLGDENHIRDWISLLESLLQWLEWLKQDTIETSVVEKSQIAMRWLIRHFKFTSPRLTGMLENTIKMHLPLHIARDILDFGVPSMVNSTFLETSHITICKETVENTQKRKSSVTIQAGHRYCENTAIDRSWDYLKDSIDDPHLNNGVVGQVGGRCYHVQANATGESEIEWVGTKVSDNMIIGDRIVQYLFEICLPNIAGQSLNCFTEYKVDGQIYRASPWYMGGPWNDYVNLREVNEEEADANPPWMYPNFHPARILTFVDLSILEHDIEHVDEPGLYALVEMYEPVPNDNDISSQILGHFVQNRELVSRLPTLYLVGVDRFVAPTIGMANIGGVSGDYLFMIKRRCTWAKCWTDWIEHLDERYEEESETSESGDEDEIIGEDSSDEDSDDEDGSSDEDNTDECAGDEERSDEERGDEEGDEENVSSNEDN